MVVRRSTAACTAKESSLSYLTRKRKGERRDHSSLGSNLFHFTESASCLMHLLYSKICVCDLQRSLRSDTNARIGTAARLLPPDYRVYICLGKLLHLLTH